jgi:hypothetical protein
MLAPVPRAPLPPDDDDWVGEPPEGRYTRDRAKPEFWRSQTTPLALGGAGLMLVIIVLVIVLLTR